MAYTFDQIFAADPSNPENVAGGASVTIYAPGDATMTPLTITTPDGGPLVNPIPVNANGFASAFAHATLDRVAWAGGGFTGFFTSYEGLKQVAVDAAQSAADSVALAQAPTDDQVDAGIARADIPAIAAEAVANDPSVASSAATMAQSSAGLMPLWKAGTAYSAGQRVVAPNGDIVAAKATFTSGTSYLDTNWGPSEQASKLPTKVAAPYVWGITDASGYPAIAAEADSSIRIPRLNPASRTQVAALGDSLTNGYSSGTAWALTDAWPAKLQGALSGVTVTNLGRSGATASELNFSVGAKQMWFTGTINASGSSTVATLQGQAGFQRQFDVVGTLSGVAGTMRRLVDGTFSFTRTASGTAVTLTAPTKFKPTYGNRFGDIVIIGIGRNDVTYLGSTMGDGVIQHVVGAVQMVVDHLLHQSKRVIVTGTLTATNEPSGSVNYNRITSINNWLKQLYPAYWLDIRRYLIDKAITDLGITPTADDNAKIASDTLPPSIMDDSIHYSRATANILALNQYKPFLVEKGWV